MRDAADVSSTYSNASRRWTRRSFLFIWGGLGAGATLLAACGPASAPAAPTSAPPPTSAPAAAPTGAPTQAAAAATTAKNGGTFRFYAWTDDPPSLDPYVNVSYRVQEFSAFFYSRLLMSKKGPDIKAQAYIMEGDLAESWGPSQDGKTWTFKLRPNAR